MLQCKGGLASLFGSNRVMVADMQMLFAALMFGVGFVGQKEVMVEGMGPMTCNALRFALSTVFLAILIPFMPHNVVYSNLHAVADDLAAATAMAASFDEEGGPNKHAADAQHRSVSNVTLNFKIESVRVGAGDGVAGVGHEGEVGDDFILEQLLGRRIAQNGCCGIKRTVFLWGSFLGLLNFCVSGLQQWGLVYTSASKVAFIAGFDIILTPLLLLVMPSVKLFGQPTASTWFSVFIGLAGMFLISGASASDLSIGTGELLSLSSTFVFVFYLLYTDYATVQIDSSVHMMVVQLGTVSAYSLIVALLYEQHDWEWHHLLPFFPWLMYMAATEGVGFLLMAMGQLYSPPTHVAIILSLEGVFAAVGSALVLHEELTAWEIVGCALILTATLVAKIGEEMPCYDSCADNSYMVLICGRCQCDKCRSSSDDRKHKGAGNSVSCGLLCSVYAVLKDCCWRQHHAFSNVNHILKPFVRLFGSSVSSGGGGSGPSNSSSSKPNSSGADLGVLLLSASSTVGNGQVHRTAISGGGGGGNGTITV